MPEASIQIVNAATQKLELRDGSIIVLSIGGVARAYEILKDEMVRVMRLIGCNSISELDHSYVKRHAAHN